MTPISSNTTQQNTPSAVVSMLKLAALGIILSTIIAPEQATAQGCVAVRGTGIPLNTALPELNLSEGDDWLATLSTRYLHSTRHFVGDVQQYERQDAGNQVINHQEFIDLGLQYAITPRWTAGLVVPFSISERSQLAPASFGGFRYSTHSSGLGDVRLGPYFWIWDPKQNPKGNIQVGMALKVPSGDDGVTDTFLTSHGPVVHPVDQSIQPGDGGWGFTLELNAYREILPRTSLYLQALYLVNPEDQNGVLTWRDNSSTTPGKVTANPGQASYYEHQMSIPDQYFGRAGVSYLVLPSWGLSLNLGGRLEGIPVHDLVGGSDGFRRPGTVISIEPGISLMKGRFSLDFSVPWAIFRARWRSVADEQASAVSGNYVHGDAAFADFLVAGTLGVRF